MQSFRITDGKKYIYKARGKYITCTSLSVAGKWSFRDAQKILMNNIPKEQQKSFYLEGTNDLVSLDSDMIDENLRKEEFEKHSLKEIPLPIDDLKMIETYVSSVSSLPQISREQLLCMKNNFKTNVIQYDNQIEDVKHWILLRNPPVYMYPYLGIRFYKILKSRARVKQNINYINGLLKAYEKNYPFNQLIFEVKEREYKDYKPRTAIFREFDDYYKKTIRRKDKKTV